MGKQAETSWTRCFELREVSLQKSMDDQPKFAVLEVQLRPISAGESRKGASRVGKGNPEARLRTRGG